MTSNYPGRKAAGRRLVASVGTAIERGAALHAHVTALSLQIYAGRTTDQDLVLRTRRAELVIAALAVARLIPPATDAVGQVAAELLEARRHASLPVLPPALGTRALTAHELLLRVARTLLDSMGGTEILDQISTEDSNPVLDPLHAGAEIARASILREAIKAFWIKYPAALDELRDLRTHLDVEADAVRMNLSIPAGKPTRRRRGRPKEFSREEDWRIYRDWKASGLNNKDDFARKRGMNPQEARLAIDRGRPRRKSASSAVSRGGN